MPCVFISTALALCSAQDGACEVQRAGCLRRAGDDEAARQLDLRGESVYVGFEFGGHRGGYDAEVRLQLGVLGAVGREFRADGEEFALNAFDDAPYLRFDRERPRKAERGDRLVAGAVGLRSEVALGDAPSVEQAGFALVALFGVDLQGFCRLAIVRLLGWFGCRAPVRLRCIVGLRREYTSVERNA